MSDRSATENQVSKLTIETYEDQLFNKNKKLDLTIVALFNPTEYSLKRSNEYKNEQSPGSSRPSTSFTKGDPDELTLTLFFDGTGAADDNTKPVVDRVQEFYSLMEYHGDTHKPPYLHVHWGGFLNFFCFLKSAAGSFTLFDRKGVPIRAKITATFQQVIHDGDRLMKERSASPNLHQVWIVHEGESLDYISYRVYGDTAYWRELARVNKLVNPRALPAGMHLRLPPRQ